MKIGFLGTGNMGGAIIRGMLDNKVAKKNEIIAFDKDPEKSRTFAKDLGIKIAKDVNSMVEAADIIFLAVKPNIYEEILPEIKKNYGAGHIIVSVAAGISLEYLKSCLGSKAKLIRIMPNTPAMVGKSMTAVCRNDKVADQQFDVVMELLNAIGRAEEVSEELMDTVTGLSGSGPAYVYMFIEALTNGAIKNGMDEKQARTFAAQTVSGAAEMVLQTKIDPLTLRENVCSPGGTTIEAVEVLLKNGFMDTVLEGMQAAIDKSKTMTK